MKSKTKKGRFSVYRVLGLLGLILPLFWYLEVCLYEILFKVGLIGEAKARRAAINMIRRMVKMEEAVRLSSVIK